MLYIDGRSLKTIKLGDTIVMIFEHGQNSPPQQSIMVQGHTRFLEFLYINTATNYHNTQKYFIYKNDAFENLELRIAARA